MKKKKDRLSHKQFQMLRIAHKDTYQADKWLHDIGLNANTFPDTHIKLLQWEGDGFALYYKRLERGTFERPKGSYDEAGMQLSAEQLSLILQGISLQHIRKRKRYQQAA